MIVKDPIAETPPKAAEPSVKVSNHCPGVNVIKHFFGGNVEILDFPLS